MVPAIKLELAGDAVLVSRGIFVYFRPSWAHIPWLQTSLVAEVPREGRFRGVLFTTVQAVS